MNKFIVNNILIEKSERDIKIGNSLEFTNGFNLVCGNNEAGKSSIMNFLKESFFLEKGTETGKIFFQINENGKKLLIEAQKRQEQQRIYQQQQHIYQQEIAKKIADYKRRHPFLSIFYIPKF